MPDTYINKWPFKSDSTEQRYTVSLRDDGRLSCDCLGWKIKRDGRARSCKHTRAVIGLVTVAYEVRDDECEYINVASMNRPPTPKKDPVTIPTSLPEDFFS